MSLTAWGLPIVETRFTFKLEPEEPIRTREHTSSLSKLLLARTLGPAFTRLIARRSGAPPKPLRVSVPHTPQGTPLTPMLVSNRKPQPDDVKPVTIDTGKYTIVMAAPQTLTARLITEAQATQGTITYRGVNAAYELTEVTVGEAYPSSEWSEEPQHLTRLQVTLETPTIPKDPLIKGKYAPFTNAPDVILSIPAYIAAKTTGAKPAKTLQTIRKCLIPPHTAHCRLRKTWYIKRTRSEYTPLPALTGTIQYIYNDYQCNEKEQNTIIQVAKIAKILGTGRGRASGFGQTTTEIK